MLTSKKIINAINEQIGYEFSASMQYYAIAAHFAAEALPQLSQHFFQQAEEEKGHALRFIKYVVDAGGRVVIPAIDAPKSNFKTPRDAVKLSLDLEIHVTQQINGLVELARKENDYITINFLQWFLTEQLEEVSSMDNLLKIVQRGVVARRHGHSWEWWKNNERDVPQRGGHNRLARNAPLDPRVLEEIVARPGHAPRVGE